MSKKSPRNFANQQKTSFLKVNLLKNTPNLMKLVYQCAAFFGWFQTLTSFTNVNWTSHRLRAPRVPKWTATPRSANGSSRYPKRFMRNGRSNGWGSGSWILQNQWLPGYTLPETNRHSPWKCMLGIRLFLFGMAYFSRATVSLRECIVYWQHIKQKWIWFITNQLTIGHIR